MNFSDNPAHIFADILIECGEEPDWLSIIEMGNYLEEEVENES